MWLGSLLSTIGDWVLFAILPFFVYQETGSPVATGLMLIAQVVPPAFFGSLAGTLVDRWDRRWTMIGCNLARAAILLILLMVPSTGWSVPVYAVAFLLSLCAQFFTPARSALIPDVVPRDALVGANSLDALIGAVTRLVAPAVGGVLLTIYGLGSVVSVDIATFLVSAVCVALIRHRPRAASVDPRPRPVVAGWRLLWMEHIDGLRQFSRHRPLIMLLAVNAAVSLSYGIGNVLLIVFVRDTLQGNAMDFGVVSSAQAVGGICAAIALGALGSRLPLNATLGVALLLVGGILFVAFGQTSVPAVVLLLGLSGAPITTTFITFQTRIQSAVSGEYRGRAFGLIGLTGSVAMFAGIGTASVATVWTGPGILLQGSAILYALMGMLVLVSRESQPLGQDRSPGITPTSPRQAHHNSGRSGIPRRG